MLSLKSMMLMENERCLIKKIIEKIVGICIFPILIMIGLTFTMGFYSGRDVFVILEDITIQLGDKLPEEITEYTSLIADRSNLEIESNVPLDNDGNVIKAGEYVYYLVYSDSNSKFSKPTNARALINVIDTIKPIITTKDNVKISYNGKVNVDDIATCEDLAGCEVKIIDNVDTTKSGEHEINIEAIDGNGNKSYAKTKIVVAEKPKPKATAYRYNSKYNEINEAKNKTLTEEEKNSLRAQIVAYAKKFIGNPYVYGGTSLTDGTDCSGFTMTIYNTYGYILPRTAPGQGYAGISVSASELLPGDIVVYHYDNGGGHVGIYAGDGMLVHASTPSRGIMYEKIYKGNKTYRRIIY